MKKNKIVVAVCMAAALIGGLSGCDDSKDFSYKGNLDLNQLVLTQAREAWVGGECNITVPALKYSADATVANYSYKLGMSLYQGRTAGTDVSADLVIDADTLGKAIAKSSEGGLYEKYAGAVLLPAQFYRLSTDKLVLSAGSAKSEDASLLIYSEDLIAYVQDELKADVSYVLPVRISESSSYDINPKTSTLMYFVSVTYVEPEFGPEYYPVEDEAAIGDAYADTDLKLVWHDEFNGTGIPDPEVWRFEEGFCRNQEAQWYYDQNAICKDGALVITGKQEQIKNPNYEAGSSDWKKNREYAEYTSSSIVTKNYRFRKGTMVVRAKIPTASGAWPAIWTTGGSTDSWCWEWPLGGEIDLLEYYYVGDKQSIHANACWGSDTRWSGKWDSYNRPLADFEANDRNWGDKYHIWRMDWDDDYIKLYLDDELMNEIDLNNTGNGTGGLSDWWRGSWRNPFRDAGNEGEGFGQQIFLNLALGSNGGTPDLAQFPLEYHVDYVRVYQHE
ncbi:BT_3987 domain-containing protein [Bacteroides timonensis]|uniref:BT_3987 domain-containing protein n=1 Tax=Bacteroides timonensis TaxID=1470345 RepID=UPI0004AFB4DE|nr:DUF1735 domain-containing protein [Bacteroides timonensis]